MNKLFDKLMEKKKGKPLPDEYKNAKMSTLSALHGAMSDMMGSDLKDGLHGMKEVKVASDSPEGLSTGLEKAKAMLDQHNAEADGEDESEDEDNGAEEILEKSIDHEAEEGDLSEEDIDSLIAELEEKKAALKMGK